jgi:host factor-I protein
MTSQTQTAKELNVNCQDNFLIAMKNKCVTVFLINGVKLKGTISEYDDISLLLSRDDNVQLIYKNAISTMMPYIERM